MKRFLQLLMMICVAALVGCGGGSPSKTEAKKIDPTSVKQDEGQKVTGVPPPPPIPK